MTTRGSLNFLLALRPDFEVSLKFLVIVHPFFGCQNHRAPAIFTSKSLEQNHTILLANFYDRVIIISNYNKYGRHLSKQVTSL